MNAQKGKLGKSAIIWLAAIISTIVCVAALLIWLLSSFNIVGGRLYDKDEYFVIDGTAYSNAEYFELDGKAYDFATYFEIDGVAYDYESSFEFEGASYPRSEYFTAGDRLYDYATYFCLNDTAYAHADYFLLSDTAYDRAEWFEHDGAAYRHSEHYVAHDRLYEIKEITLGGKTFMSDVTELELRDCGITDISVLADCGKLEKLDLGSEWESVSNLNRIEDISALSELYGLKYLDLSANKISDASPISGLINLEHLNLELNRLASIEPLAGLINVTYLDISDNYWTIMDENFNYKVLYDHFSDITPLSGMTKLTHLDISDNPLFNAADKRNCLEPLSGLTELTWLDVSAICFYWGYENEVHLDISPLAELVNLTVLNVSSNWEVDGASALSYLTGLVHLDLCKTQINDASHLSGLTELVYLDITSTGITDLSPLSELTRLEALLADSNLAFVDGTYGAMLYISDVSPLAGMKNLRYLAINEGQAKDYSPLYALDKLEYLSVSHRIGEDQLIALRAALPGCKILCGFDDIDIREQITGIPTLEQ